MNDQNLYQTPEAEIVNKIDDYDEVIMFSASQRIGRVRWLGYSSLASIATLIIGGILAAILIPLLATSGDSGMGVGVIISLIIVYIIPIILSFILAIRRLHDLDKSGWLSLLFIVPLVNLVMFFYLLFAPGTKGENEYGKQPQPNTIGTWLLILIFPVMIGILAAIALPAYQDYVKRVEAAQMQQE